MGRRDSKVPWVVDLANNRVPRECPTSEMGTSVTLTTEIQTLPSDNSLATAIPSNPSSMAGDKECPEAWVVWADQGGEAQRTWTLTWRTSWGASEAAETEEGSNSQTREGKSQGSKPRYRMTPLRKRSLSVLRKLPLAVKRR